LVIAFAGIWENKPTAVAGILASMGLIASYFVASMEEAIAIDQEMGPDDAHGTLTGPALLPTDLDDLSERLGVARPGISLIASSDATWLLRFEDTFSRMLSDLPAILADEIADRYQLSAEEIDVLESVLRPLAIEALGSPNRSVYEWISV
jgi:hypothetical protein